MASNAYAHLLVKLATKTIDLATDAFKMGLMDGGSYTPNLMTDTFWADIDAGEISGAGYTAGGEALSSVALTLTAANSWTVARANGTAYTYGKVVRPAAGNGFVYKCVVAGTSGGSILTYPTVVGQIVGDGGVTWACLGYGVYVFSSDTVQWPGATFDTDFAVIYDTTPGSSATDPLLSLVTFGSTESPAAQTYQVIPDPVLGWFYFALT